jgi:16S rRNA G1207 methylase RsmC
LIDRIHDLAAGRTVLAPEPIEVDLPPFRGKRLLPVLSWLLTNSPVPLVAWRVERRFGPEYVRRELAPFGWELEASRDGRWLWLEGAVPAPHELPPPRSFVSGDGLRFEADYGVFSPERVDPGSALLLDVAARLEPAETLADIGVGYGALAISLVARGLAARAVASDVDSIALWLAERNASAAGVPLDVILDSDPVSLERTPLTVCNVPTHLDAAHAAALMSGLAERAYDGRLLAVVHASLADRYARHLTPLRVTRHAGAEHVVLDVAPKRKLGRAGAG